MFNKLIEKAKYSIESHSRDLVYETYGMAKMAYGLKAISFSEYMTLNKMLIVDGINNPKCKLD